MRVFFQTVVEGVDVLVGIVEVVVGGFVIGGEIPVAQVAAAMSLARSFGPDAEEGAQISRTGCPAPRSSTSSPVASAPRIWASDPEFVPGLGGAMSMALRVRIDVTAPVVTSMVSSRIGLPWSLLLWVSSTRRVLAAPSQVASDQPWLPRRV